MRQAIGRPSPIRLGGRSGPYVPEPFVKNDAMAVVPGWPFASRTRYHGERAGKGLDFLPGWR